MKVALLTREYPPDTAWGGIAAVYHGLASALSDLGHEVHVICQAVGEPKDLKDDGLYVHRVGANPKRYSAAARISYSISAWFKLRQVTRQYGIELVEASYWGAESFFYSLGMRRRVPLVLTAATRASDLIRTGTYSGRMGLLSLRFLSVLEGFCARRAQRIVANSEYVYGELVGKIGVDPDKIEIVHQAVDTSKYRCVRSDIRGRLGIREEVPLVLFVGRLEARKGIHVLCEAIPEIVRSLPGTQFVLVGRDTMGVSGGGSERSRIREKAEKAGFLENLVFIDFLPEGELIELYSSCDLVVSPSLHESFGLVAVEAMACGRPVAATRTGIAPELGLSGVCGAMATPGDARELAEAVVRLLSSLGEEEKELAARANRELVESRFSIPVWVDKVVKVYEKALNEGAQHGLRDRERFG